MNLINFQETVLPYYNTRVQLWEHLKKRTKDALEKGNQRRIAATATPEAHQAYVAEFRQWFIERIGGLPAPCGPSAPPPQYKVTKTTQGDFFQLEHLLYHSREDVIVPAHLYLPTGITGPRPAVLMLCGHSTEGKASGRYQTICQILVRRGFVVLAIDPPGQGERLSYYDPVTQKTLIRAGTGEHEYTGLQCTLLGRNITRYFLHDAIRAVDLLQHHPLVDSSRIGITGSSGGGTQTCLMMLVESRLAAAAPTTFVSSRMAIFDSGYAQDAEQIWQDFAKEGYDHADLLAAFAPKPLNVQVADYDYFPLEGTLESLDKARPFWEMYGVPENLGLSRDESTHRYTDALGHAAANFFARHFGASQTSPEAPIIPFPVDRIFCTKSGQILGDFPNAKTIFEENRHDYLELRRHRKPGSISEARTFLKRLVYENRFPMPVHLRITDTQASASLRIRTGFWWSQRGILNTGVLIQALEWRDEKRPVTIATWKDGTRNLQQHAQWIFSTVRQGRAVLVVNPSGVGPLEPAPFNSHPMSVYFYGTQFRIADDLHTLGDCYAALRTYDVLRSLETLPHWPGVDPANPEFFGEGPYGIYAALAATLAKQPVRWDNPMPGYEEILLSKYYNDYEIKLLIVPGLLHHCDWVDLVRPFLVQEAGMPLQPEG